MVVVLVLIFGFACYNACPKLLCCCKSRNEETSLPMTHPTDRDNSANNDNLNSPDPIQPEVRVKVTDSQRPEVVTDVIDPGVPVVKQVKFAIDDPNEVEEARISIEVENEDKTNVEAEILLAESDDDGHHMPKTCMNLPVSIRTEVKVDEGLQTTQDPNERESPEIFDHESDCDSHGYSAPKGVNLTMSPANAGEYREAEAEPSNDSEECVVPRIVISAVSKTDDNDPELTSDDDDDDSNPNQITIGPNSDNARTDNEENGIIDNKSAIASVIPQLLTFLNPPDSPDSEGDNDTGEMPPRGNALTDQENDATPACSNVIPINLPSLQQPVQTPHAITEHQDDCSPTVVQVPVQVPISDIEEYHEGLNPQIPPLQVPISENMENVGVLNPTLEQQPDIVDGTNEGETEDGEGYSTA